MSEEDIVNILYKFKECGIKNVLLTGVSFEEDKLGIALFDGKEIHYHFNPKIDANFHGSGDTFASVFSGALLNNKTMLESAILASKFVCKAIECTLNEKDHNEYGLNFEQAIGYLLDNLK